MMEGCPMRDCVHFSGYRIYLSLFREREREHVRTTLHVIERQPSAYNVSTHHACAWRESGEEEGCLVRVAHDTFRSRHYLGVK